ncbi:MAG TPA: ABC transporter permease [Vicinamibacterales bacterium]
MTTLAAWRSFVRALLRRREMERDMDAELEFHIEARTDHLVAMGLDRAAASRQARLELGDPLRWKEQGREARGLRLVDNIRADIRYGTRWLRRSPGFAMAAVFSIALGICANTAIFSLVNALLLKLMPVDDPQSLVFLSRSDDRSGLASSFSYPFFRQLEEAHALERAVARASFEPNVEAGDAAERVSGEMVSGEYFHLLGVRPHLGRLLTQDDNRIPGGHPLVVLSYVYWQRRFGGDAQVVGKSIRVNTHPMTIVGVTPAEFTGLEIGISPDIRVPIVMQAEMLNAESRLENPHEWWLQIFGRLADPDALKGVPYKSVGGGTDSLPPSRDALRRTAVASAEAGQSVPTVVAVQQQLDGLYQRSLALIPNGTAQERHLIMRAGSRGQPSLQNRFTKPLTVLSGLAAGVLLLVCLNLANLMLARTVARRRELAVRIAVGATRDRIVVQLLVETLLIAATGGVLGLILARWAADALASVAIPAAATSLLGITLDWRVLAFALALSVLAGFVSGIAPAFTAGHTNLASALSTEGRTVAGGRLFGRKLLVGAQIAVSFALLTGAGLFARTLVNLRGLDFGFETEHLLSARLDPTLSGLDKQHLTTFLADVNERVAAIPGVRSASFAAIPLLARSGWGSGITLDTGVHDDRPGPDRNAVGPRYFTTVGMTILEGREFTDTDVATSPRVAVVNQAFAQKYFDTHAIGRRIGPGGPQGSADFTIVGIVRNGKYADLREEIAPFWYVPYQQLEPLGQSDTAVRISRGLLSLHVRTAADPGAVAAAVRSTIASIDKRVTLFNMRTMREQISDQLTLERLLAVLGAAFAVVAVVLAALGLYGVVAYDTTMRTRELGLRMALGETASGIIVMILRQTAWLVTLGLSAGVVLAIAGVGYVRSLLYGLQPTDPLVIVSAAAVVVTVTTVAALVPARRATHINPIESLN